MRPWMVFTLWRPDAYTLYGTIVKLTERVDTMKHVKMLTRPRVVRAQMTTGDKLELVITILSAIGTIIPFFEDKETA